MSVAEIKESQIHNEAGEIVTGGLSDRRMGSCDKKVYCYTCNEGSNECPGHFGHIELAKPCYHIGFLKIVLTVLRCVCYNCANILADINNKKFVKALKVKNPKKRLHLIMEVCSNKPICKAEDNPQMEGPTAMDVDNLKNKKSYGGCGCLQPRYFVDGVTLKREFKAPKKIDEDVAVLIPESGKHNFPAEKALDILSRIPQDQCELLGFNYEHARPDWMILQLLPVPPPAVRPSVMADPTLRSEDDLTHQLGNILANSNELKLRMKEGAPEHTLQELIKVMQFQVATYMNNDIAGAPKSTHKSGRPIKSIFSRLKAKEGRIRGNLMGKRVDFSARTVITADPTINIFELGVPRSIANRLTYPETVTETNINRLRRCVKNGWNPPPGEPGAKYYIRENGKKVDLRYKGKTGGTDITVGCIVERNLIDGDYVLFNRQPSLHKMSIMGHRIRVLPWSTFRLNLSVTSPYNADFDGDEMNMHVPQSEETRAEIEELMLVPKCIVSPQANRPVMGIVQDSLLGCRKITQRDTFLEKDVYMNILLWWENFDGMIPTPAILKPRPLWTGKQVFHLIIPKEINLIRFSAWHVENSDPYISPEDTCVRIEKGELITGTLCKKTLGSSSGSLIHVIWEEVGPDQACKFLGHCQWLVNYWLLQHGFTMGIGDTIAEEQTMESVISTIQKAKQDVQDIIKKFEANELSAKPGRTKLESFEGEVNTILNKARDDAGKLAQVSLSNRNNLKAMVTAGSKGSFINVSQMAACVGQQNVEGKRIPYGFQGRTLPHFKRDDRGPESRGFVENSYLVGLTPQEFFFHAMGGREGLIDTACKTAETGYIQRRLVKAMEDIMVKYDGTVRNSLGDVIQFLYGEDGLDAVWIESQNLNLISMKREQFEKTYKLEFDEQHWKPDYIEPEHLHNIKNTYDLQKILKEEYEQLDEDRTILCTEIAPTGEKSWPLPVNLQRIIWNAQKKFKVNPKNTSDLSPGDIIEGIKKLQEKLIVVRGSDPISIEAQRNATLFFKILLRSTMASKRVLKEYKLTKDAFEWVLEEIESRFLQSMVPAGEMIGCVAAQSIGEPATQMTLNTFHFAGVSAKNVTLGVPRLRELINVAKNLKTPSLSVFLKPEKSKTKELAKSVQAALEYTTLRNVTEKAEIWFDPDVTSTVIEEDRDFVEAIYETDPPDVSLLSPWLLRLEMNRDMMVDKNLHMQDICQCIQKMFEDDVSCIFTDDNAENLVVRMRLVNDSPDNNDTEADDDDGMAVLEESLGMDQSDRSFLKEVEGAILEEGLKGIKDIHKVFVKSSRKTEFDDKVAFTTKEEWSLDTEGVNLMAVLGHEDVDSTRTISNNIVEVFTVLGIEAARKALLEEIRNVISFDGSYVNYRHLAILCDTMTYRGSLMAITRHGINRNDKGALMRCSFEETVDILLDAAAHSEHDRLRGVSENIILGLLTQIGSGHCSLFLDQDMLENALDRDEYGTFMPSKTGPPTTAYETPTSSYLDSLPSSGTDSFTKFIPCTGASGHKPSPTYDQGAHKYGYGSSPASPGYSPASPGYHPGYYSPASPGYNPTSPSYKQTSATYSPMSPAYSPTSPQYNPQSPQYNPQSPQYSPQSPQYNVQSPQYNPQSPQYSAQSPSYSPTSQQYCPASPAYSPTATQQYSPASPVYSPTSQQYKPSSTASPGQSSAYSPASPPYKPSAYTYSPTSPSYNVHSPSYKPASQQQYVPTSPAYSPFSPVYRPASSHDAPYSPSNPGISSASAGYSPTVSVLPAYHSSTGDFYAPTVLKYDPTSPSLSPTPPKPDEGSEE